MKLVVVGLTALALSGCAGLPIPGMGMPTNYGGVGGTGMTQAEIDNAQSSLNSSQAMGLASAARPGDEAMDCAALQAELTATMRDPRVMAAIGSMGARAQDQKARVDAATASGRQSQPTAEEARMPLASASDMASIMPQIMRGQRINALAAAKNCAFLKAGSPG